MKTNNFFVFFFSVDRAQKKTNQKSRQENTKNYSGHANPSGKIIFRTLLKRMEIKSVIEKFDVIKA